MRKFIYMQPVRKRGLTSNNFYSLYDMAMLGITNHSKVPLRIATMIGFALSGLSLLVALDLCRAQAHLLAANSSSASRR